MSKQKWKEIKTICTSSWDKFSFEYNHYLKLNYELIARGINGIGYIAVFGQRMENN